MNLSFRRKEPFSFFKPEGRNVRRSAFDGWLEEKARGKICGRQEREGGIILQYHKQIRLKNNMECCLRSGREEDGQAVFQNFNLTHSQTDYLLTYPDENRFDAVEEGEFLRKKADSNNEIKIIAVVGNTVAGTAGIEAVGTKSKVRHRAEFGISVDREFWGLGIGTALMDACIECAGNAGYEQLELNVVAGNTRAVSMYEKAGFVEYGRNPKGFKSRTAGFLELIYMRLEL